MEISNICSICLHNDYTLIQSKEVDTNNVSWSEKLKAVIPEIAWNEEYNICKACLNQVEIATLLRDLCLQNQAIRLTYIKNEQPVVTEEGNKNNYSNVVLVKEMKPVNEIDDYQSKQVPDDFGTDRDANNCEEEPSRLSDSSEDSDYNDWPPTPTPTLRKKRRKKNSDEGPSTTATKKEPKKTRTKYNSFNCDICSEHFTKLKDFTDHSVNEHNLEAQTLKPYKCPQCDSKFSASCYLLRHSRVHEQKRSHICTYCGKGYIHRGNLKLHEKEHLNKREYQCDSCPKSFNTFPHLRSHKLVVHTDKNLWKYICPYCDRRFPIKTNYDQHVRRHIGERNFSCHLCEKTFIENANLKRHLTTHTNVRAHKCEHCPKEFKLKKVLRIHMAKAHGIGEYKIPVIVKKHECTICGKKFVAKNKLSRHMCTHTGERPFPCTMCDKRFTDGSYVTQHLKTVHGIVSQD